MLSRLVESFWAIMTALDILLCACWLSPLYIVGLAGRPTGRQLISTYVGEAQHNKMKWARIPAAVIDFGAELLGDGPDHCYRTYLKYHDID